jgi:hypothetical protein
MPATVFGGGAPDFVNAKPAVTEGPNRGKITHAQNDDVQANRRFVPALKNSNVLREGLMREGGR